MQNTGWPKMERPALLNTEQAWNIFFPVPADDELLKYLP